MTNLSPNSNLSSAGQLGALEFPAYCIVGSVGDLAGILAEGTEVPEEFYFACALTMLGLFSSNSLSIEVGLEVQPRLYTVLLGASYDARKSTAMKRTISVFEDIRRLIDDEWLNVETCYGVGSAEGLIHGFNNLGTLQDPQDKSKRIIRPASLLLAYDELRAFVEKCKVQNSSLLPMATSLFECNSWDNTTKEKSLSVRDAHLSLMGCCTTETYANMWTNEAIAIGFPNRLFVVSADRKRKVAWPGSPDPTRLREVKLRLVDQLERLPLKFGVTADARGKWEAWYLSLPSSEHVKRLDTIGFRLLALIALATDKKEIDAETVSTVVSILNYEFEIRRLTDPIDADNTIASLESAITRQLQVRGPLSNRELRKFVNAKRPGLWAFDAAIRNLIKAGDIGRKNFGRRTKYVVL